MAGGVGREGKTITVFYHKPSTFTPRSQVLVVVPGAGRNGWTYRDEFPYGLAISPLAPTTIEAAFAADFVVFLGERDDENEVRGDLVRTPEVDVQGTSRIDRGKYFYNNAVSDIAFPRYPPVLVRTPLYGT